MTVQAYILIQTEVGKAANVASQIAGLEGVTLAEDVTILPGTQLHGATAIAAGATVGPDTTLDALVRLALKKAAK